MPGVRVLLDIMVHTKRRKNLVELVRASFGTPTP